MGLASGTARGVGKIINRLVYPARKVLPQDPPTREELDAWVVASGEKYFEALDRALVDRARSLGVDQGMVLDLGSPLGLVPLKILWEEEHLLCMAIYRSLEMAERARETAEAWKLGDRMFFQVGDLAEMRLKTGYFDIVVSDGGLHEFGNPSATLKEIQRVVKPGGAIVLREFRRPGRFALAGHIARYGPRWGRLRPRFEAGVRAGFTPGELGDIAARAGVDRVRILAEDTHVILERPGVNDPASWVTEREKYF